MKGARKAGMHVIGVDDKYTIIEETQKKEICDRFICDFDEVTQLFIKTKQDTFELASE